MPALADTDYARARLSYYDVEVLQDAFTLTFIEPKARRIDLFGLLNPEAVADPSHSLYQARVDATLLGRHLWDGNAAIHDWDGSGQQFTYYFHDLSTVQGNLELAKLLGVYAPTDEWIQNHRGFQTRSWGVVRPDAPNRFAISQIADAEQLRPVCDVDERYSPNELHPFFVGYNSKNYDTSMIAVYLSLALNPLTREANRGINGGWGEGATGFTPVSTRALREWSDVLFSPQFIRQMPRALVDSHLVKNYPSDNPNWNSIPHLIRRSMLDSGRHVDMAELNEANRMIALKRQGVTIGRQVKESDRLSHNSTLQTIDDYYELLSYNLADVILNAKLFEDSKYNTNFDLKLSLMRSFPGVIYDRENEHTYEPVRDPYHVKSFRATPDTTSAQFVAAILCPYGRLSDMKTVSFQYPHPEVAAELGIESVDVLDTVSEFFRARMALDPEDSALTQRRKEEALEAFDEVYAFYDSIRGRNFNESKSWVEDYGVSQDGQNSYARKMIPLGFDPEVLKQKPEPRLNIPYFRLDGSATSCFVNFSTGGIHGAEYRQDKVEAEVMQIRLETLAHWVTAHAYATPKSYVDEAVEQYHRIAIHTEHGEAFISKPMVVTGASEKTAKWKNPAKGNPDQNAMLELAQAHFESPYEIIAQLPPAAEKFNLSVGPVPVTGKLILTRSTITTPEWDEAAMEALRAIKLPENWTSLTLTQLLDTIPPSVFSVLGVDAFDPGSPFVDVAKKDKNREVMDPFMVDPSGIAPYFQAPLDSVHPEDIRLAYRKGAIVPTKNALRDKFAMTSVGEVIHEDFTSYYPNMLRNMRAFFNEPLGTDLYAQILGDKDRYEALRNEARAEGDTEAANRYNLMREGTKLILNSASGAGDTSYDTPIRMNNRIISMRIIGQLFTWWVAQAQVFGEDGHVARIVSTNTDGIYSMMQEDVNNRILARESKRIGVEIEPEAMIIVSKDSNNRIELMWDSKADPTAPAEKRLKIVASGGGSLACMRGPRTDKRLSHPAIMDYVLSRYLQRIAADSVEPPTDRPPLTIDDPADRQFMAELMREKLTEHTPQVATFFQNVISVSASSYSYPATFPFVDINDPSQGLDETQPQRMQHINRVFYVRAGDPDGVGVRRAVGKQISAAGRASREKANRPLRVVEDIAVGIMRSNGLGAYPADAADGLQIVPNDRDIKLENVTGLSPLQPTIIDNRDLHCITQDELDTLMNRLDIDFYVNLVANSFNENWRNAPVDDPHELAEGLDETPEDEL